MKKIGFSIAICTLLFTVNALPQEKHIPYLLKESMKKNSAQLKSGMYVGYPQHTEEFNWATNWVLFRTIETSYESFGDPEVIIITEASGKTRELHSYDIQQRPTMVVYQNYTGSVWVDNYREKTSYNSNGFETEFLSEQWSGSAWVLKSGRQNSYTMDGNRVQIIVGKEWNPDTQVWDNSFRETYTYTGSATNFATVVMESWDTQWVFSNKMEYTWSGNQVTQVIVYDYQGNAWIRSAKYVYEYPNATTNVMTMYSASGTTAWDPSSRITSTYDSHGNQTLEQTEMYLGAAWMVFMSTRYTLTYSGNNLTQRITEQSSLATGNVWKNVLKEVFSNFASLSTGISVLPDAGLTVFPNPAGRQATVRLSSKNAGSVTLQVMAITGQVVFEDTFTVNASDFNYLLNLIDVQPGSYLLFARDKQGNEIGKTRLIRIRD